MKKKKKPSKIKKNKTNVVSDEIFLMPLLSPWFDKKKSLKKLKE